MTTYDLSPLLRSSVGFDVFDNIFDSVFNLNESNTSYPPYNILKSDNNYTISLAIAGFSKDEIDVLHAPIGFQIESKTPAEIAISIMAEVTAKRHGIELS